MKYNFETVHGRSFVIDCDEFERIQAIVQRAALDRAYDPKTTEIWHRGKVLDPTLTLHDHGVDFKKDVLVLHGTKKSRKRPLTMAEEDEMLEEAEHIRKKERDNVISLESIRDNLKAKQEELAKPTFLSKEQRRQRAMEKREEAAREEREKLQKLDETRRAMFEKARQAGRDMEAQAREQKRAERAKAEAEQQKVAERVEKSQVLDQIKAKYLGQKKQKKVVQKQAERFMGKKIFDWDQSDDTTDATYANVQETNLLFGRGFKAGIDAREQLEGKVDYEQALEDRETERLMDQLAVENARKEQRAQLKQMLKKDKAAS